MKSPVPQLYDSTFLCLLTVLYRHLLENQARLVAAGKDPMNVFRDPNENVCLKLPTRAGKNS